MNQQLNLTSYDYDELKSTLVEFIRSYNPEFSDIDYSGSAIDTINSLLSRNSQLMGYAANFIASESFLNSAQLRKNIVASAAKLSHVPRSRTASRAVVKITVKPSDKSNLPVNIEADKGLSFLVNIEGNSYTFTNKDKFVLSLDENDNYVAEKVDLYEGRLYQLKQVYNKGNGKLEIPNKNIDTSTLSIAIDNSNSNLNDKLFREADSIKELNPRSSVYFLSENSDELYTVEFGKGVIGSEPADGAVIKTDFIAVSVFNNNVNKLICGSSISGYSNIDVEVLVPSYGGSEREDKEITRFLAPLTYKAQNRAVNDIDYVTLLRNRYGFIKTGVAWGGEKNIPPRYGDVMIALITNEASLVSSSIKTEMERYLDDYCVGAITPIIVDPEYFYIKINSSILFDGTKTKKSFEESKTEYINHIMEYSDTLNDFTRYYNDNKVTCLTSSIPGFESISNVVSLYTELDIDNNIEYIYNVDFFNTVKPGSFKITNFRVSLDGKEQTIKDDKEGNIVYSYIDYNSNVYHERVIGDIDYTTGIVNFSIQFNSNDKIRVIVCTEDENVYTRQQKVLQIKEVTAEQKRLI